MPTDFVSVFAILIAARVRFVIVGGLAVLLHGVDRLTADIDLALDLAPAAATAAMTAFVEAGFRPMAPVDPLGFADVAQRSEWRKTRGMEVFSLWDPQNRRPTVDIFSQPPIPFEELWRDAVAVEVGTLTVRVASIEHLIRLKESVGRPKDLDDIARLRQLPAFRRPRGR
jgi:hypothetical protein